MANNKDIKRGVVIYLDGKEIPNNAKAIRTEMKKVRASIDQMTIGSEEYVRATKKYAQLKSILQEHKAQLKEVEVQQKSMLSRGTAFVRKYAMEITSAFSAITGVALELNKFRKMAAEKEDSAANLKALTGLSDENIQWLTKQAETLSTTMEKSGLRVRKSATEILEAYMLVGSKKPELLQDKEALNAVTIEAMRLAEAAKMELKDAVNGVTLAMNQYGASAEEASRYVNVLAAGSKYGAVGVATQTESIVKAGVAANMAKVPIEQLVGVLETLGERGIEGQIAGTQLKTFFLRLEAGAKDTRPSVVGLQQALENLAAKNLDVTQLTKMFGMESISTAQALISSADKVKYYTDAVTGTSTAIEQARINSDTTAAKMAQVRNQINLTGQELAKTLAPVMSKTVGWTRRFVMMLPGVIDFLKKYGASTVALLGTLLLYNTHTAIATKVTAAWNTVMTFARTQTMGFTAAMGAYRTALTGSTTAHVEMTAAVRGTNIVTQAGVVAVGLMKAAYYALSLQMTACARTLRQVKVAMAESGFGLAVIAIGAAVAAIMHHNEKIKEARRLAEEQRKAERELYKEYNEAAARIRLLRKEAENQNKSLTERKKAIEQLQKLAPDYQASISEEGKLIEKNKEKLDEYLERLKASIVLEAYKSKMTELLQKQMEAQDNQRTASDEYWKKRQENTLQGYDRNGFVGRIMQMTGLDTENEALKAKNKADQVLQDIDKEIETTEQRMTELAEKWNFSLTEDKNGGTEITEEPLSPSGGTPETESERQKRIRQAIEAVNTEYDARANKLKQQYIDGRIASEQEYSQQLEALELERLNRQLEIAGLEPKQREQLQSRLLDIKMKLMQQLKELDGLELDEEQAKLQKMLRQNEEAYNRRNSIIAKATAAGVITEEEAAQRREANEARRRADDRKAEEQEASRRLAISRKGLDAALLQLRKAKAEEGMTEDTFNAQVRQAQLTYYEKALEDQKLSKEDRESLEKERAEAQLAITEENNKKIEESNRQLFDALRSAGDDLGQALADWLTDTNATFKDFSKELLKTIVKTVENIMTAAIAQRTIENIRTLGFWGIAKAAGEIALIKTAGAVLNGLISNFYTGGYTGQGRWDEPRGIVHAGEFVANRQAVASPAIRPVLDLINQAQQSGNIANLTAADIAAVATAHTGSRPAEQAPTAAPAHLASQTVTSASGTSLRDPELTRAIQMLIHTTARAAEAYREPSPAICWLEGPGGINPTQELLSKIKANASRKL